MGEQSLPEHETPPKFDVGILFVHGIGRHPTGETLTSTAGPLLEWLEESRVDLAFGRTVLKPDGAGAALSEVVIQDGANVNGLNVLLAESCWAETFEGPSSLEFAKWIYGPGTSILVRQMAEWVIEAQFRIVELANLPFKLAGFPGFSLPDINDGSFLLPQACLIGLAALVLVPPFQVLILLLAALSTVPFLQIGSAASQALRALASVLGDAEVFCQGVLGRQAIETKVMEDLADLKGKCRKTVLAAHSQGAAIALEGLSVSKQRPDLLITYGSGWRKLQQLQDTAKGAQITRFCQFILPIVTAAFVVFVVGNSRLSACFAFLVYVLFVVQLGWHALLQARKVETQLLQNMKSILERGKMRWVDIVATLDPVPAGILLRWEGRSERRRTGRWVRWAQFSDIFKTCLVVNTENPVADHTSYWQSPDFLRSFAETLAADGTPICTAAAFAERTWSYAYRRFRCRLRNVCHVAIYAMAAYLYWRADSEVRRTLPLFVPFVATELKSVLEGLQAYAPAIAWLLGALAMVGVAFAWTHLVSGPVWTAWDRHRGRKSGPAKIFEAGLFLLYLFSVGLPLYFLYLGAKSGRIETAAIQLGLFANWLTVLTANLLWDGVGILMLITVLWVAGDKIHAFWKRLSGGRTDRTK
jgi:hypothetical protein